MVYSCIRIYLHMYRVLFHVFIASGRNVLMVKLIKSLHRTEYHHPRSPKALKYNNA